MSQQCGGSLSVVLDENEGAVDSRCCPALQLTIAVAFCTLISSLPCDLANYWLCPHVWKA